MYRLFLSFCFVSLSIGAFAGEEIAGEVTPAKSEIPLKTPNDDDDVIIMEEDSNYEENEEEDSDTDSAEGQYEK